MLRNAKCCILYYEVLMESSWHSAPNPLRAVNHEDVSYCHSFLVLTFFSFCPTFPIKINFHSGLMTSFEYQIFGKTPEIKKLVLKIWPILWTFSLSYNISALCNVLVQVRCHTQNGAWYLLQKELCKSYLTSCRMA